MFKKLKRTPIVVIAILVGVGAIFSPSIHALITKASPKIGEKVQDLSDNANKTLGQS